MSATSERNRTERPVGLDASTFAEAFQLTAAAHADRPALRTKDDEFVMSWGDYAQKVRAVCAGLAGLGLEPGQALGIMLTNRPEFHFFDSAALHLGATPFSVYNTYAPEQIQYQVQDAGAQIMVTERAFLDRVGSLEGVEHVVVVDGEGEDGTLTIADTEAAVGHPDRLALARPEPGQPDDGEQDQPPVPGGRDFRAGAHRWDAAVLPVEPRASLLGDEPDVMEAARVQRPHYLHHPRGDRPVGAQEDLAALALLGDRPEQRDELGPLDPLVLHEDLPIRGQRDGQWLVLLGRQGAAATFGRSIGTPVGQHRRHHHEDDSSTSMTSTNGVTLISDIGRATAPAGAR